MVLDVSKPVLGVYNQVRLKQTCSAIETSWDIEILPEASSDMKFAVTE